MSEIGDLENRLSAALDRIAQGLDQMGAAEAEAPAGGVSEEAQAELSALKAALDAERADKAELIAEISALKQAAEPSPIPASPPASDTVQDDSANIAALKEAHAAEIANLHAAALAEREAWEGLNSRVVRMRRSNKQLRSTTLSLRQAAADMVVDADLINQSLQVELDAERAAHELERAETDVILKTLQPLLGDAAQLDELEETV